MSVGELRAKLAEFPDDALIYLPCEDDYYSDPLLNRTIRKCYLYHWPYWEFLNKDDHEGRPLKSERLWRWWPQREQWRADAPPKNGPTLLEKRRAIAIGPAVMGEDFLDRWSDEDEPMATHRNSAEGWARNSWAHALRRWALALFHRMLERRL